MSPGGGDFQSAFDRFLAFDFSKVDFILVVVIKEADKTPHWLLPAHERAARTVPLPSTIMLRNPKHIPRKSLLSPALLSEVILKPQMRSKICVL